MTNRNISLQPSIKHFKDTSIVFESNRILFNNLENNLNKYNIYCMQSILRVASIRIKNRSIFYPEFIKIFEKDFYKKDLDD